MTGFLLPDAVTPLVALSSVILLLARSRTALIAAAFLLIFALLTHYSHIPIFIPCLALLVAGKWLGTTVPWNRITLIVGCLIASFLIGMAVNYARGLGPRVTSTGAMFSIQAVQRSGNLARYLQNSPEAKSCSLYSDRNRSGPKDPTLLWNPNGYIMRTKSFYPPNDYRRIFLGAVRMDPAGFLLHIVGSGLRQLMRFSVVDDLRVYSGADYRTLSLERFTPSQVEAFANSRQQQGTFGLWHGLDPLHYAAVAISLLGIIWAFFLRRAHWYDPVFQATVFVLLFVFINAFVCGGLATIRHRFQARVAWLLVLLGLIMVHRLLAERRGKTPSWPVARPQE
jgi:hypothetical protein